MVIQFPIQWQLLILEIMSYLLLGTIMLLYSQEKREDEFKILMANALVNQSRQVSHDIRSPLSVLNLIASNIVNLPEEHRNTLRSAVNRINDIANQLLQKDLPEQSQAPNPIPNSKSKIPGPVTQSPLLTIELLPSEIDIIVSEKRVQFRNKANITIQTDFGESYGTFAKINSIEFKRVLSNLINNAVEALIDERGRVTVAVRNYPEKKLVLIRDNGRGIPRNILNRLGEIGLSHGKTGGDSGAGLGIYHAKKTIESFGGKLLINSQENIGTEIRIEFPNCIAPNWFIQELTLTERQILVVVDDDQSVLAVWNQRIKNLNLPSIQLYTFCTENELQEWLNLEKENINKTLFLVDYEFNGQNYTGLDLIAKYRLSAQSILVTSRYDEQEIQSRCEKLQVKLIPKPMLGLVPINLDTDN